MKNLKHIKFLIGWTILFPMGALIISMAGDIGTLTETRETIFGILYTLLGVAFFI